VNGVVARRRANIMPRGRRFAAGTAASSTRHKTPGIASGRGRCGNPTFDGTTTSRGSLTHLIFV